VLARGFTHPALARGAAPVTGPEGDPLFAVVFSFPVAMALATGTEAPSTAIAQLGQLGPADRRRFARGTLVATFVIVAGLTIGLAGLAVRLHVGIPRPDSTQIADIPHAAAGPGPPSRPLPPPRAQPDPVPSAPRPGRPAPGCCWPPPAPPSRPGRAC